LAAEHDSVALRLPACLPARDARRTRDCHGVTPLPPRPSRFNAPVQRADDGPRINGDITAFELLVIDSAGEKRGVMSRRDALRLAEEEGFDLVEVAPQATPPVCKIMDYGKFKYEEQKRQAEARKKQKVIEVKELKMRPGIDDHDYDVKLRAARRFFEEGDKVKFTLRFRGREMVHQHLGMGVLARIKEELADIAKVEQDPRLEGRQMQMVMSPR
jgi:translation initiation factor IF-3